MPACFLAWGTSTSFSLSAIPATLEQQLMHMQLFKMNSRMNVVCVILVHLSHIGFNWAVVFS
jgi:hypothetical protein